MTRRTPDPVLAEAARAELEHRARRSRRSVELRAPQTTRRDLRQLAVAAAVGVLILGVVLGLTRLQARLVAAPPPTVSRSAEQRTAPPSAALIAPEGFRQRSDAELRAWAATLPQNAAVERSVWIEQQIIIVHCMAGKGFLFDPVYRYEHAMASPPVGHEQAYEEALHGRQSSDPYRWQNAGCTGRAAHETGQDSAG